MSKIVLGKYVNTHGLKGEIRIKSNVYENDSKVFLEQVKSLISEIA